jgi:hypothetical protein
VAFDQSEFQDVYDRVERPFTLLGYCDRARYHSWFHQVLAGPVEFPEGNPIQQGRPIRKVNERKLTLPPAHRAYGPEGTVNSEPLNREPLNP